MLSSINGQLSYGPVSRGTLRFGMAWVDNNIQYLYKRVLSNAISIMRFGSVGRGVLC